MKTIVVRARVDMGDLATCAKFFDAHGFRQTSQSQLISTIVSMLAEQLADTGLVGRVADEPEALQIVALLTRSGQQAALRKLFVGETKMSSRLKDILTTLE